MKTSQKKRVNNAEQRSLRRQSSRDVKPMKTIEQPGRMTTKTNKMKRDKQSLLRGQSSRDVKSIKTLKQTSRMTAKNISSGQAKKNSRDVQFDRTRFDKESATNDQNTPPSILKIANSTRTNGGAKKVQWKPNLYQKFIYDDTSSNQVKASGIRVVDLASLQDSKMVNSASLQRQNRRKTKHEVKANSDDLEFTEINH